MKKILLIVIVLTLSISAETLFEIKDLSDNPVMSVSNDGLRIFNAGDTLMVITSSEIKAYIDTSSTKALSRSFSVSTNASGKGFTTNVLEVSSGQTSMREGVAGDQYTNFSPENIFVGLNSGGQITTGKDNVFIGNESGFSTSNGSDNVFIGNGAGQSNVGGFWNNFIGKNAGGGLTTGNWNNFFGMEAGYNNSGYYNIFIGHIAGQQNSDGWNNTFLGSQSGANNNGSYNVFIGNGAGQNATGSNRLYIDNSNTGSPLLYGEFDNDLLRVNGDLNVTGSTTLNGTLSAGNTTVGGTLSAGATTVSSLSASSNISTTGGMLNVKTLQIADLGLSNLGLDGDIVPYGGSGLYFDLGNNNSTEHWDDAVVSTLTYYTGKDITKNSKSLESGLDKIMQLRPVSYKSTRQRFGLIPEEVEKIIPEAVISQDIDVDPETGKMIITETEKGMNYIELIPVLIKTIQEQQEMIEKQDSENADLKARLEKIENAVFK